MELKSVEIVGFKSFADKLTLTFNGGITAIVGPNGSGKSNVSDAIRWVLGEQSAKSLRGARMEDVIFAGTERRRPVNFAQVTLTLDNKDRSLAYDYDEVAISRKMYRSGESEYLINGVRCRLRDVQELLMDTGIGKDGYSIIGQGRIDQLLSNKPQDRRMIFEEAAGIVKFKVRREEANKQLLEEQNNLQRVSDILEEASRRLGPLEKQARDAKVYMGLADELKKLEIQTFLRQYGQLLNQHQVAQSKLDDLNAQLEEARAKQVQVKESSQRAIQEAEEAAKALADALQELSDLRLQRESQDGQRKLFLQRMEQLRKEGKTASERLEEVKNRLGRRQSTYEKELAQLTEYRKQLESQQAQQLLLAETERQIQGDYDQSREELQKLNEELEVLRHDLELLKEDSARQEVRQEQEQGQHGDIQQRLEELEKDVLQKEDDASQKKKSLENAQTEYESYCKQIMELTDAISNVRERLKQAQARQQEAEQSVHQVQSRIKWLQELEKEYEGYAGSVKIIMQRAQMYPEQYAGVLGTVADLIQVPERLSTAVEIALGAAVQNIVTDTQQTAKALIEYLRTKKAGRATFLPLDHMSGREVRRDEQLLRMPGVIGYASELIEYDDKYRNIFSRLLGNVVIAEDFDCASAVANRYGQFLRVVTLKGDIFNIGGSITGGSTGGKTATILNRKGELDTLYKQLESARQTGRRCMEDAARLGKERQAKAVSMEELSQKRDSAFNEVSQKRSEYEQAALLLQMVQNQQSEAKRSSEVLNLAMEENKSSLEKMHQELANKQAKYDTCLEKVAQQKEKEESCRRKREEMRNQTTKNRIEISTSQMLIASMERSAEREETDMEQDNQVIAQYERIIQEGAQELSYLESEIQRSEAELGEMGSSIEEYTEKIDILTEDRDVKEERQKSSIQESEEAIRLVSDLEKEQYRLDNQAGRSKKELGELQDRIWEKYELTYNAALRLELPEMESQAATNRRVAELKEQIKQLGPVNTHAVEEYETLQERCTFLSTQLEDVRKAEASLREIIQQLTEQMEKQFRDGFSKISEQFNQVFRKMFGGGKGMLRLEEEGSPLESGIEIVAQPPGKTLKSMTALSGGERALTAIAILFAIQQLKPAPFCILDEIEAALDDANVNRYADFLKTLCDTTQFVVITHRKGTMEAASTMYGITMEEKGVSKCISVKFE